jgi:RNA polymerase sigma-70 factor (ECF subfamily)
MEPTAPLKDQDAEMAEQVRRAARGDADAFERLMAAAERSMFGQAVAYLRDEHLAQDAVQETMLLAWRNLRQLDEPRALRRWLSTILVRACEQLRRRRKAAPQAPLEVDIVAPVASSDEARRVERHNALRRAVQELDPVKQAALALKYTENLGYREIAARLGLSEDAVRGQLYHAREHLRQRLRKARP